MLALLVLALEPKAFGLVSLAWTVLAFGMQRQDSGGGAALVFLNGSVFIDRARGRPTEQAAGSRGRPREGVGHGATNRAGQRATHLSETFLPLS
jgi:hypothetical protein